MKLRRTFRAECVMQWHVREAECRGEKEDGMSSCGFVSVGDSHVRVDCRHVTMVRAWREMRACVHYGVRRWRERVYMHACDHLHSLRSGCST